MVIYEGYRVYLQRKGSLGVDHGTVWAEYVHVRPDWTVSLPDISWVGGIVDNDVLGLLREFWGLWAEVLLGCLFGILVGYT